MVNDLYSRLRLVRILSSWPFLILIFCTATYLGSHVQASYMAFNAASGDVFDYPHDYHLQVLVATGDGQAYTVAFNELDDFRVRHPGSTYLYTREPDKAQFRIPPDQAKFESRKGEPGIVVETYYRDDEWSIVGRYRVEGDSITPLYCRAWNRWLLITASLFFGLPLVPCVWLLGRCLKDSTIVKLAGFPAAYR